VRFTNITHQEIRNNNPRCFIVYSDNILEATNILDLLSDRNPYLELAGVAYEPIDQPMYLYKVRKDNSFICIKVAGKYENWVLPENVGVLIHFIDKPDFVITDCIDGECVFVGETTGTANVGNSQWQREGRKISAAEKRVPMVYQTYYSGTDRSMFKQKDVDSGAATGQIREPTSLQVISHLIYSLRYKVPTFVIYYQNPEYDAALEYMRDDLGRELLKEYITLCLLYKVDNKYKDPKKKTEIEIYKRMIAFVTEAVKLRGKKMLRIDKDFPIEPVHKILTTQKDEFISYLVDFINEDGGYNGKLNISGWNYKTFPLWKHRYNNTPLLSRLEKAGIPLYSYLKSATKAGFVTDTAKLITFLDSVYFSDAGKFAQKLNPSIPTLIIPTLMFQKKDGDYIYKVDPGTGEVVAFSELFSKNIENNKTMNVLVYVHVPGPDTFNTTTKLYRAIKKYADCLLINERIYEI